MSRYRLRRVYAELCIKANLLNVRAFGTYCLTAEIIACTNSLPTNTLEVPGM